MKRLTLSQSAEIAAFAETYAKERFGVDVVVSVRRTSWSGLLRLRRQPLARTAGLACAAIFAAAFLLG